MKYFVYPFIFIAMCANSALANTDWTPVFKSMQQNCNYDAEQLYKSLKSVPNKYKSSVISNKVSNQDGYLVRTIDVKSAKAFGYPLKRIEVGYPSEGSGDHITLYFSNKDFLNLKSSFYYQLNGYKLYTGVKQNFTMPDTDGETAYIEVSPTGYRVEGEAGTGVGLEFNPKNNSLTCYVDA